jgi:sarcosine oxidase
MQTDIDVAVIGAGVMGSAIARAVARGGRAVAVFERDTETTDSGGSRGQERSVRLSHNLAATVRIAASAVNGWRELEAETGTVLLQDGGVVQHGSPDVIQVRARALREAGYPGVVLDPDAAESRWPGMRFTGPVLFDPVGGRIRARRAIEALRDSAAAHGASFTYESPVAAVDQDGTSIRLHTPAGVVRCRHVVIAAGAWMRPLIPERFASKLPPIKLTAEQPVYAKTRDTPAVLFPSFVHHHGAQGTYYGLPAEGGLVKLGIHATGKEVDPDTMPTVPDEEIIERIQEYVAEWMPGVGEIVRSEYCVYDLTPDDQFVLLGDGSVFIAGGFSGHGFKFAPWVGQQVADAVAAGSGVPWAASLREAPSAR